MKHIALILSITTVLISKGFASSNLEGSIETKCVNANNSFSYAVGHALKGGPLTKAVYNKNNITHKNTQYLADASNRYNVLKFFIEEAKFYTLINVYNDILQNTMQIITYSIETATYKAILKTGDHNLFPEPTIVDLTCTSSLVKKED